MTTCPKCGEEESATINFLYERHMQCGTVLKAKQGGGWNVFDQSDDCKIAAANQRIAELEAENTKLREANDAYAAQMKAIGVVPYLDRMEELAARAEQAEAECAKLQQHLITTSDKVMHLAGDKAQLTAERDDFKRSAIAEADRVDELTLERDELRRRCEVMREAMDAALIIMRAQHDSMHGQDFDAMQEAIDQVESVALAATAGEGK